MTSREASRSTRTRSRGRPPKYDRPSQVVAVTLPVDVVKALSRLHSDIGWAIVSLVEKTRANGEASPSPEDAQLVEIGAHESLIVVTSDILRSLPGVQMIALSDTQSFLALEPGCGMSDLEIAVIDRIEHLRAGNAERVALERLRAQLRKWRRDPRLRFHARSLIIVERKRQS